MCNITNSLESNPGPLLDIHKCDVETRSLRRTYTVLKVDFMAKKETSCCTRVKLGKLKNISHSYILEFLMVEGIFLYHVFLNFFFTIA